MVAQGWRDTRPEPHHLEDERFLAKIGRRAEPNWQVDLPEGLDVLGCS
jgi:hypothetical protein